VGYKLTIDLLNQKVIEASGAEHAFDIEPFRKQCLLNGWDDIGLTLRHKDKIAQFETARLASMPWLDKTRGPDSKIKA
jgi:3-isopropylmalate/(R)-2-methylmalate dehydratase small subunit